LILFGSWCRD